MASIQWTLESRKISQLKPHPKNARVLSKHDNMHLTKSINKFGLIDKPIINTDNTVIGGHQRLSILKKLKEKEILCWVPSRKLSQKEVEELNIRLNKNTGDWDWDKLANEWDGDELVDWGFKLDDMQIDMEEPIMNELDAKLTSITQPGDEYQLDKHMVFCEESNEFDYTEAIWEKHKNAKIISLSSIECDGIVRKWISFKIKLGQKPIIIKNGQVTKEFDDATR